jgi:hypothetical protein
MSSNEENTDHGMIVTIRLIRSFHHRNIRNFVVKNVDKDMLVKDFKLRVNQGQKKVLKIVFLKTQLLKIYNFLTFCCKNGFKF